MAHIEDTLAPHFTGHVGPVRFVNGHGNTEDPDLLDYFRTQAGRYVVDEDVHAPELGDPLPEFDAIPDLPVDPDTDDPVEG